MEWKSSTHKEKYGNIIGEVNHHTLLEDGSITHYDVKFGSKIIKNIPADKLSIVKEQSHKHEVDKGEDEEEEESGVDMDDFDGMNGLLDDLLCERDELFTKCD